MKKGPKLQKEIQRRFDVGEIAIDFGRFEPRHLNEALMDLGRVYCQARRIDCDLCPVRTHCFGFKTGRALSIPLILEAKKEVHDLELLRIVVLKGQNVLSYQKHEKEWLTGQYELPTFTLSTSDNALKQYPKLGKKFTKINVKSLKSFKTAITKYRITNRILSLTEAEFKKLTSEKSGNYSFVSTNPVKTNHATSTLKVFKKLDV